MAYDNVKYIKVYIMEYKHASHNVLNPVLEIIYHLVEIPLSILGWNQQPSEFKPQC